VKENQVLKYLNRRSMHTDACFAAIPTGVMKRLASLTTRTEESELTRMDELYPAQAKALKKSNLAPDTFPTLGKLSVMQKKRRRTKTCKLYDSV
jgi:hypothetical protein